MNIKNQKVVTVIGELDEDKTVFTSLINLTFVPQYMIVKKITSNLIGLCDPGTYYNLNFSNDLFNIKSSLINYEYLNSYVHQVFIDLENNEESSTEIKVMESYTEHLDTKFKLNNQIINGNYSFEINAPKSTYTSYQMNVVIQLEFVEYA